MEGRVKNLVVDRGYGFIRMGKGEPDLFFHFKQLSPGLPFDATLMERLVEFDTEPSTGDFEQST